VNNQTCLNYSDNSTRCLAQISLGTNASTTTLVQYGGVLQDFEGGGGAIVVNSSTVELEGNAWKAFPLTNPYNITAKTELSFDFNLLEEAEGHAICAEDDVDPFSYRGIRRRCVALGGSSAVQWSDQLIVAKYRGCTTNCVVQISDLFDKDIGNGQTINYISLIQDNDSRPKKGRSRFSNIKLYESESLAIDAVFYDHDFYGTCEKVGESCGECSEVPVCVSWNPFKCTCNYAPRKCINYVEKKIPLEEFSFYF
jgi:hypothetical protein